MLCCVSSSSSSQTELVDVIMSHTPSPATGASPTWPSPAAPNSWPAPAPTSWPSPAAPTSWPAPPTPRPPPPPTPAAPSWPTPARTPPPLPPLDPVTEIVTTTMSTSIDVDGGTFSALIGGVAVSVLLLLLCIIAVLLWDRYRRKGSYVTNETYDDVKSDDEDECDVALQSRKSLTTIEDD